MRGHSAHLRCATVGSARTARDTVALVNSNTVDVSRSSAGVGELNMCDPTGSALYRLKHSVRVARPLSSSLQFPFWFWSRALVATRLRVCQTRGSEKRCDTN